ncbi:MAG: low molecular weight protein-tyrosine-phosphatase, partial [bacterium]
MIAQDDGNMIAQDDDDTIAQDDDGDIIIAHRVLFVCLGNICRSPTAQGVLEREAEKAGLTAAFSVDSAGVGGWHAGDPPDPRSQAVAAQHEVVLPGRARQVRDDDFSRFDHLICMD